MSRLALIVVAALGIVACEDGPYDAPPPGDFACGATFCDILTQVCVNEASASTGTSSGASSTCENIPAACNGTPSCSCVSTCTGATCSTDGDGAVTVTCK